MTIPKETEVKIRQLHLREHLPIGTVASCLSVHPDVVERVISATPGPKPGKVLKTKLGLYLPFIDATLKAYPKLVSTRLYDMIKERGYTGSPRMVRRYVQHHRPQSKEVFFEIETLPGEQMQLDWGHVGTIAVQGGTRQLWVFAGILCYSRLIWAELVLELDVHSLCRSLLRAVDHFGGNTRQWVFDNTKAVVVDRIGKEIRFNGQLLDFAGQMLTSPIPCDPYKPNQKGKIERAIRFLKERFFAGRTILSIEQGNTDLTRFLAEIANARAHVRQRPRTVQEVFDTEEKPALLGLPDKIPQAFYVTPCRVNSYGLVQYQTNRYSVPTKYAKATLTMEVDDKILRVLDGSVEVANHVRCYGRNQTLEVKEHRKDLAAQKRQAAPSRGIARLMAELPGFASITQRWVDGGRNMGYLTRIAVQLLDSYGTAILGQVVVDMNARSLHDVGIMSLLCIEKQKATDKPKPALAPQLASYVVDCEVLAPDLGEYDDF